MAELAVNTALLLVGTAEIALLLHSKFRQQDVQGDIIKLKSWLEFMKAFIIDNSGREGSKMLEDLLKDARDIAYDIEDVLDEIVLHSPPYTFHSHRAAREIHKLAHQVRHRFPLQKISEKIASIRKDIDAFEKKNKMSKRNLDQRASSSSSDRIAHRLSPLLLDDEMVGYEKKKKEFMRQLVDGEKKLLILAVEGPGGSGKTTFVKNVFSNRRIQGRFDCRAWGHVSRHVHVEELCINVLKQFCGSRKEPYPADDGSDTSTKLRSYLAGKRYILVLDDISRHEDWEFIKNALPNEFHGSRIIVTTGLSNLASHCASSSHHRHKLNNGLEWLEGWKLFCRKAFLDSNGECPSELMDPSMRIVKRCEGSPLAIVAVGIALAQKPKLPNEWERFHKNLESEIRESKITSIISNALLHSYIDLPSELKCCFLYFSIFPEDHSVKRGRLIRLWVAERFAMEKGRKTAEEVAEEYLNELIHRNLVQVFHWDFDSRPRNCRVRNLALNFIIQKCEDENFASIFSGESTSQSQKIRRLVIHNDCTQLADCIGFTRARSIFFSRFVMGGPCTRQRNSLLRIPKMQKQGQGQGPHSRLLNESLSDFEKHLGKLKLVRVLDLHDAPDLTEFPKDITRLTLLRYLSFRGTRIKIIPSSIKNLSYLETLDLKQTDVTELPQEISYLHNLRHLLVYYIVNFDSKQGVKVHEEIFKVHEEICNLANLQDLCLVEVGQKGGILNGLKNLMKLRKLGLTELKREHGKDLCAAVELMENLRILDVCSATQEEYLELGEMTNPPKTIERLYLKGRLTEIPRWVSSLDNLLRIVLKGSKMQDSPLTTLKRLPNLMELQLVDCYNGEELIFEASRFNKLKILLIEDLARLHTILIQDGAMPELKKISLRRCPQLKMFPLGIHNLIKVEELTLYDMAEDFIARLRTHGEDREWVEHIPVIHSFTLNNQSRSFENLSYSDSDSFSH